MNENQTLGEKIIPLLMEGKTQKEISIILREQGVKPYSLSSIEKEIKMIREWYDAKTMFHLGVILGKDEIRRK
ncbi:MAG: hypothetical protein M5Z89_08505 [Olivibacter sp.]|nr:hypothetical protein [Olivibacter sp. UJ_SKK_5.1]